MVGSAPAVVRVLVSCGVDVTFVVVPDDMAAVNSSMEAVTMAAQVTTVLLRLLLPSCLAPVASSAGSRWCRSRRPVLPQVCGRAAVFVVSHHCNLVNDGYVVHVKQFSQQLVHCS